MRKILSTVILVAMMIGTGLHAQEVSVTTAQVEELKMDAYTVTVYRSSKYVEQALERMFKDSKLKTKKVDSYQACQNTVVEKISASPINLYTKIDGDKKNTTITMCAYSNDLTLDRNTFNNNVRTYLQNFVKYLDRYEAITNMEAKEKELKDATKELEKANEKVADLEKNTQKNRDKIADNKKDIEKYKSRIADCEKNIEKLQNEIEKSSGKELKDAQSRVTEAQKRVSDLQAEINKYRSLAQ